MKPNRITQSLLVIAACHLGGGALAAEEKAMMDKMMQAGVPGEAHKKLDALAGKFTVLSKSWMDPAKPPEVSKGTSERTWLMGGRYLEERHHGSWGGQPFTGMGITGYDNVTKKYFGTWVDSMSTSMTMARGVMDGNTIRYQGMMSDPLSGKEVAYTMTMTIAGNDSHLLEMWSPGPGGKNVKWMELAYTRVK